MKKILDFNIRQNELLQSFEAATEMVLSTCSDNRVTSRIVSTACCGDKVYFLSWEHHVKCHQIHDNPRVAICHGNIQIEGIADIKGNPLAEANMIYSQKFKMKQPRIFDIFTQFKGMILIEVSITSIRSYVQADGEHYLDCLDFTQKTAYRENMKIDA